MVKGMSLKDLTDAIVEGVGVWAAVKDDLKSRLDRK